MLITEGIPTYVHMKYLRKSLIIYDSKSDQAFVSWTLKSLATSKVYLKQKKKDALLLLDNNVFLTFEDIPSAYFLGSAFLHTYKEYFKKGFADIANELVLIENFESLINKFKTIPQKDFLKLSLTYLEDLERFYKKLK